MTALKTLIFTVFVPGTVTMLVPYWLLSSRFDLTIDRLGGFRILGLVPILLGALMYLWSAWEFTFAGKGTPAPIDPPKELVARGLYRFVRNPIYIGVSLVIIGESLLFESTKLFVYALLLLLVFHLFVVYYEEPTLRSKFGESYEQYSKTVPRWMPRVRRVE